MVEVAQEEAEAELVELVASAQTAAAAEKGEKGEKAEVPVLLQAAPALNSPLPRRPTAKVTLPAPRGQQSPTCACPG